MKKFRLMAGICAVVGAMTPIAILSSCSCHTGGGDRPDPPGPGPVKRNDIKYNGDKAIIIDTLATEINFTLDRPLDKGEVITASITKYIEQSNQNVKIEDLNISTEGTTAKLSLEFDGINDGDISAYALFNLHFSCGKSINKDIDGFKLIYSKYNKIHRDNLKCIGSDCYTYADVNRQTLQKIDFSQEPKIDEKCSICLYSHVIDVQSNLFVNNEVPVNIKCLNIYPAENTTMYIHANAFAGWTSLEYVYISGVNVYLDSQAFAGCSNLKTIDITSWDDAKINSSSPFSEKDVFTGLPSKGAILTKQQLNSNMYYAFQSSGVPETWFYYDYIEEADDQFKYVIVKQTNDKILSGLSDKTKPTNDEITIPADVTAVAPGAFKDCFVKNQSTVNKISVEKGSKLRTIHGTAFENCTNLEEVDLSNAKEMNLLGIATFYNCSSITKFTFPESLNDIGTWCFYGCSSLDDEKIIANTNVGYISTAAFAGCTKLSKIELPKITAINAIAFQGDTSLNNLIFPSSLVQIAQGAFSGCTTLSNFQFESESKMKFLFANAFKNCNISSITMPGGLAFIDPEAFGDKTKLESISFSDRGLFYQCSDNAIYKDYSLVIGCSGTTKYSNPERIKSIGSHAFENCLVNNNILDMTGRWSPGSQELRVIESIDEYAFANISSKTQGEQLHLYLPNYITTNYNIKYRAFYQSKLRTVTISKTTSNIEDEAFNDSTLVEIDISSFDTIPNWTGKNIFGGNNFPTNGKLIYDESLNQDEVKQFFESIGLPPTWQYEAK